MANKQYSLMLVLALVAGLVGGVISSQFFVGQAVLAQERRKTAEIMKVIDADVVKARSFMLTDDEGHASVLLRRTPSGEPFLSFRDKEFNNRLTLGLNSNGSPHIRLFDKNSESIIFPTAFLVYSGDKKKNSRIILGLAPDEEPVLQLIDSAGYRATLGRTMLSKGDGVVEKRPASSLILFNEKGNAIWQAP